ncbi:MAG: hypothetical protein WD603_02070 [Patescibacteria group bacterium]
MNKKPSIEGDPATFPDSTERVDEAGESVTALVPRILEGLQITRYRLRRYVPKTGDEFDEEKAFSDVSGFRANVGAIGRSHDPRALVSLSSKVEVVGDTRHLPLLDFSNTRIPDLDISDVEEVLIGLGQRRGFILHSGRCFHYYGLDLLRESEWSELMMQSAEQPAIGERYIQRQLSRGASYLRQNTGPTRPCLPYVVKVLEG